MRGTPDTRSAQAHVGDPAAEAAALWRAHAAHDVDAVVAAVRRVTSLEPRVAVVLGSGLGGVAEAIDTRTGAVIATADLPHWPRSTVAGHAGKLLLGTWKSTPVAVLAGRAHRYEGYGLDRVTLPIRVFRALGARTLVLTNAVGAIRKGLRPGSLMLVRDQLNFHGTRGLFLPDELPESALRGPFGPRPVYADRLVKIFREAAAGLRLPLAEGVLMGGFGPSYETASEILAARSWGADAACMSTVTESLVGAGVGLETAAVSCVTNAATGLSTTALTHEEVTEVADRATQSLRRLLEEALPRL